MTRVDHGAHDAAVEAVVLFPPPSARQRWAPGQIIRILIGLGAVGIGILAASFAGSTISGIERDVLDAAGRIPERVEQVVLGAAQIIATFVPLTGLVVVLWKRQWRLLLMLWLASTAGGIAVLALTAELGDRNVVATIAERSSSGATLVASAFPTTEFLASAVAVVIVGAAHVPRRWRRAMWSWIVLLTVLRLLGPGQPPLDLWLAVSLGVVVGSVILLLFGSPNLEPSPHQVLVAFRQFGLDPVRIDRLDDVSNGAVYETVERDGSGRFVKLRTLEDRSWDFLNRVYRMLRLRSSEVGRPYSTLKRRVADPLQPPQQQPCGRSAAGTTCRSGAGRSTRCIHVRAGEVLPQLCPQRRRQPPQSHVAA